MGKQSFGIDPSTVSRISQEIETVIKLGVEVCLVVGGGNIFRGVKGASEGIDRSTSDYMGMLATIMNAISIQDALEKLNVETRTLSAITVSQISEPYIRRRALRHLEKNRVVIVAGGTGNPYFTTDTAAALRATELKAEVLLKGTKVNGVFDKDPEKHNDAKHFENVSYSDVIRKNLRVMDMTAITLCKENSLPIRVFDINGKGNLKNILLGQEIGTIIKE